MEQMLILLSLGNALAAPDLRMVAAPGNVQILHHAAQPGTPDLACQPLVPEVSLCFRVWEASHRRWVTVDDLTQWKATTGLLRAKLKPAGLALLKREPHPVQIVDMPFRYWTVVDSDGWAIAPMLHPKELIARMGLAPQTKVRVAIPRSGVLLAWEPGSSELDLVMAVAVREHYDAAEDAVTPNVYTWTGSIWRVLGQARSEKE